MVFYFFMVLCKCKNILKLSIINICWINCNTFTSQPLGDLIHDETFGVFTLSHLILKLHTNLKLDPLPSTIVIFVYDWFNNIINKYIRIGFSHNCFINIMNKHFHFNFFIASIIFKKRTQLLISFSISILYFLIFQLYQ